MKSQKSYSRSYFLKSLSCILFLLIFFDLSAKKADTVRILFIGNSYTYAGGSEADPGLPKYLKEMAAFYHHPMEYDFVVKGGTTLERQWSEGKALEKIKTGKFDFVVLQDQSAITLRNLSSFREFATKFDVAARQNGAKTLLYMTWGYAGKPDMGEIVEFEYNRLGKDLGAIVVPCGLAWKIWFEKNPGTELHISDKSHPNGAGVYLNTCVFYRTLFGKLPTKNIYTSKGIGGEKGLETAKKMIPIANDVLKHNEIDKGKPKLTGPTAELVFQSGFEGTSTLIINSKNIPDFITQGYEIDDIVGVDNTLKGKNDWEKDLDKCPTAGQFLIEYTGGDSTQRYVKIIPEPGNPKNHVLQFWLNDSWHASENQQKARIQTDIYGIKMGFKEFYQTQRVFLTEDFKAMRTFPQRIPWCTISEFWNNEWWVKGELYGFRITLGIGKPTAAESDLYFILNAENPGQKEVWNANEVNDKLKVPIGKWFTLEYYFKEGNKESGRVYMAITPDGGIRKVIFDVHNFTHNTNDPAPNGFTGWSPQKLYTSKDLVSYVKSQGKTLQIYWDDFKLWRNKRPE